MKPCLCQPQIWPLNIPAQTLQPTLPKLCWRLCPAGMSFVSLLSRGVLFHVPIGPCISFPLSHSCRVLEATSLRAWERCFAAANTCPLIPCNPQRHYCFDFRYPSLMRLLSLQYSGLLFGTLGVMGTWSGRRDWALTSHV